MSLERSVFPDNEGSIPSEVRVCCVGSLVPEPVPLPALLSGFVTDMLCVLWSVELLSSAETLCCPTVPCTPIGMLETAKGSVTTNGLMSLLRASRLCNELLLLEEELRLLRGEGGYPMAMLLSVALTASLTLMSSRCPTIGSETGSMSPIRCDIRPSEYSGHTRRKFTNRSRSLV